METKQKSSLVHHRALIEMVSACLQIIRYQNYWITDHIRRPPMWPVVVLITYTHSAVPVLSQAQSWDVPTTACWVKQGERGWGAALRGLLYNMHHPRFDVASGTPPAGQLQHTAPWSGASGCPVRHLHTLVVPCTRSSRANRLTPNSSLRSPLLLTPGTSRKDGVLQQQMGHSSSL